MTAEDARRQAPGGSAHLSRTLLSAYVRGAGPPAETQPDGIPGTAALWSVEEHLERCAGCRAELAEVTRQESPAVTATVSQVHERLTAALPAVRRRRWQRLRTGFIRWAAPTPGPWLAATLLVVILAGFLSSPAAGQIVGLTLLAPVLPLLGVAVGWGPRADLVQEMIAGTARSGLGLVLRRAVVVLTPVIPALFVVGRANGTEPALALLPALALTCGSLALGSVVGVQRAAAGLSAAWALFVVLPAHLERAVPAFLAEGSAPGWALAAAVLAGAVVLCRDAYLRPRYSRISRG